MFGLVLAVFSVKLRRPLFIGSCISPRNLFLSRFVPFFLSGCRVPDRVAEEPLGREPLCREPHFQEPLCQEDPDHGQQLIGAHVPGMPRANARDTPFAALPNGRPSAGADQRALCDPAGEVK